MVKKLDWQKEPPLSLSIFMENYVFSLREILKKMLGRYGPDSSELDLVFGINSEVGSSSILANIVIPQKKGLKEGERISQAEFLEECLVETLEALRNKIDEDLPDMSRKVIIGAVKGYEHCFELGATDPVIAVKLLEQMATINDISDSDALPHNMMPTKSFYSHKDVTGSFAYNAAAKDQKTKDLFLYHQPLAIYQNAEAAIYDAEIITTTETDNLSFSFRRLYELATAVCGQSVIYPHWRDKDPRYGLFLTH